MRTHELTIRDAGRAFGFVLAVLASASTQAGRGVTQAEVQLHLCADPATVTRALDLRAARGPVETWYFDNDALDLLAAGITFRLRIAARGGELTLKTPVEDCAQPGFAVPTDEGKCELDFFDERPRPALSINRTLSPEQASALASGRMPFADALSATQARYLRTRSLWPPAAGVRPAGPVSVQAYRPREGGYVVEAWSPPAGEAYVEISQKAALADAARTREALRERLARAGVPLCPDQSPPTAARLRRLLGRP